MEELALRRLMTHDERQAEAARELGYAPRPARDALADAVDWFRANGYIS